MPMEGAGVAVGKTTEIAKQAQQAFKIIVGANTVDLEKASSGHLNHWERGVRLKRGG